jgi:hypothetical protein
VCAVPYGCAGMGLTRHVWLIWRPLHALRWGCTGREARGHTAARGTGGRREGQGLRGMRGARPHGCTPQWLYVLRVAAAGAGRPRLPGFSHVRLGSQLLPLFSLAVWGGELAGGQGHGEGRVRCGEPGVELCGRWGGAQHTLPCLAFPLPPFSLFTTNHGGYPTQV